MDEKSLEDENFDEVRYMNWLEEFTTENTGFLDDDWLYSFQQLSVSDNLQVKRLSFLYHMIDRYAKDNYIYPTLGGYSRSYFIQYNDVGYEIGVFFGKRESFFCNRLNIIDRDINFIDFFDIVLNKKQDYTDFVSSKLESLAIYIENLVSDGVPVEAVSDSVDALVHKIINEQKFKHSSKKLIKNKE